MSKWETVKLGDMLEFQRGFDITQAQQLSGNIPIVSSSGITSHHNVAKAKAPGIVIGRKGTLGQVHHIKTDYWPHDTTLWIKNFKGNDPAYLYYFLQLMHFESFDAGASNPTLNRNHIHKLTVQRPPFPIQRKIAAILSAYDDLIENNTRRIALLEKMAEEVYREWFVRLRFPDYERVPVHHGIPDGWERASIETLCEDIRDGIKTKDLSADMKYIGLEHIPRKSMLLREWESAASVESDKFRFIEGDILFGKIRPYLHKVSMAHFSGVCSSDTIVIRATRELYRGYIFFLVYSEAFVDLATIACKGSQMPRADWDFLKQLKVIVPPIELLESYERIFIANYQLMGRLGEAKEKFKASRDMLLSRLLSGKVEVENLEIAFPVGMQGAE